MSTPPPVKSPHMGTPSRLRDWSSQSSLPRRAQVETVPSHGSTRSSRTPRPANTSGLRPSTSLKPPPPVSHAAFVSPDHIPSHDPVAVTPAPRRFSTTGSHQSFRSNRSNRSRSTKSHRSLRSLPLPSQSRLVLGTALAFGPALTTLFIRLPRFISILWEMNPPSISLPLTMTPVPLNPPIQWTSQPQLFTLLAPCGAGSGITSRPSPQVCHLCNPFSRRLTI